MNSKDCLIIKQNERFGFDCLLFEKCNLNCDFCLESHNNHSIDYDWIHTLPNKLLERYKLENRNDKKITLLFYN